MTNTVEEPYLIERKYYEVPMIGNAMEGKYIRASEFEKLSLDEESTIGLYDEQFKLTYKMRAKQSKKENHILVFHNSQTLEFVLRTEKKESTRYIHKQPHPIVLKYWNEHHAYLEQYMKELQEKLKTESPTAIQHLRDNLLVDESLAAIVEANMNESGNALNSLAIQLEKIKHYYQETLGE